MGKIKQYFNSILEYNAVINKIGKDKNSRKADIRPLKQDFIFVCSYCQSKGLGTSQILREKYNVGGILLYGVTVS